MENGAQVLDIVSRRRLCFPLKNRISLKEIAFLGGFEACWLVTNGFQRVLAGFSEFELVLPGFVGLLSLTAFIGFQLLLMSFKGSLPGFTRFYRV